MKAYKIKMDQHNKTAIVFAISYISLSEVMDKIKNELHKKSYEGIVYFDYLLSNGNNFNRFAKAYFDKKEFKNFQLVTKDEIEKNNLKEIIKNFYKENFDKYVKNSAILIPALKFRIKKGLEI